MVFGQLGADVVEIKSVTDIQMKKYFEARSDLHFERFSPELLYSTLTQIIKRSLFD